MDVKELVWWWQTGWTAWAREHGVKVDDSDAPTGSDKPDRAAFRERYGAGGKIGR